MGSRLVLGAILGAVVAASCGARPELSVRVAGEPVTPLLASATGTVGCRAEHGDALPRDIPVTSVRGAPPVRIDVAAGPGATEVRGHVYDEDVPAAGGGPVERFTLPPSGTYEARAIVPGRTYRILLSVDWSAPLAGGEVTHVLRVRVGP